jgi:hypothetical protein
MRYRFFTPPIAQVALLNFDQGKEVSPFRMQLVRGTEKPTGWRDTHPSWKGKRRVYPKTGRKKKYIPRIRQFGLCTLTK